jgi:hypothetical protein
MLALRVPSDRLAQKEKSPFISFPMLTNTVQQIGTIAPSFSLLPNFQVLRPFPRELPRKGIPYGYGSEAKSVRRDLEEFELGTSPAYHAVKVAFGTNVRLRELKGIMSVVRAWWQSKDGTYLPQLSRNQKRSFPLLIKYIDHHYDKIVPLFQHAILLDEQRVPLVDDFS